MIANKWIIPVQKKKNDRLPSVSEASAETCFSSMETKTIRKNKTPNSLDLHQVTHGKSFLKHSSLTTCRQQC